MVRKLYLLIAVLYPMAAAGVFALAIRTDNLMIFRPAWATMWLVIVPGLLILATIGLAFTGRAPGRVWRLALIAWIALVTYGHKELIGIAAAGV